MNPRQPPHCGAEERRVAEPDRREGLAEDRYLPERPSA